MNFIQKCLLHDPTVLFERSNTPVRKNHIVLMPFAVLKNYVFEIFILANGHKSFYFDPSPKILTKYQAEENYKTILENDGRVVAIIVTLKIVMIT